MPYFLIEVQAIQKVFIEADGIEQALNVVEHFAFDGESCKKTVVNTITVDNDEQAIKTAKDEADLDLG